MNVRNNNSTPQENILANALREKQIEVIQQFNDGYKHIDIYIPKAKLNIEIDGLHHFTDPDQIVRDFHRVYYSEKSGYHTIHIPNIIIKSKYLDQVVVALVVVINKLESESVLK